MPISPSVLLADREVSIPRKPVFKSDIGNVGRVPALQSTLLVYRIDGARSGNYARTIDHYRLRTSLQAHPSQCASQKGQRAASAD